MPVPKQKQGRIRTHTRRSANMKISAAAQSPVAALSSFRTTCAPAAVSTRTARLSLPSNGILWMRCRSKWNHNGRLNESAIFV